MRKEDFNSGSAHAIDDHGPLQLFRQVSSDFVTKAMQTCCRLRRRRNALAVIRDNESQSSIPPLIETDVYLPSTFGKGVFKCIRHQFGRQQSHWHGEIDTDHQRRRLDREGDTADHCAVD